MDEIKIRPLADRVVIEPFEEDNKTVSGIIIPDNAKEKPQKGIVVATGPGKKEEPTTLKIGEVVIYGKYGGSEINYNNKTFLVMRESDIYAIVE
ncbi:MAG: co-chaperone GroES [Cytophagales bacterium]|jgi:chaperonin GroES|nr:co-chaperone GroES [Cytophagales bacterium]